MKKDIKFMVYGVIVITILGLAYAISTDYFKQEKINVKNPEDTELKEISCDILVRNPIGIPLIKNGDLVIDSMDCQQQYVNNCGRFGLLSDKGSIRLEGSGGLGTALNVNVGEYSSQIYTLTWCGSKLTKNFKAKLFNDKNEILQSKEITLP